MTQCFKPLMTFIDFITDTTYSCNKYLESHNNKSKCIMRIFNIWVLINWTGLAQGDDDNYTDALLGALVYHNKCMSTSITPCTIWDATDLSTRLGIPGM